MSDFSENVICSDDLWEKGHIGADIGIEQWQCIIS